MKQDKIALITGSTRGIGLGIAEALAYEGFHLALCGRKAAEEVESVLSQLRSYDRDVLYTPCDISSFRDRQHLLDAVKKHFGALNVLVNNAGVAPKKRCDLLEAKEEDFEWLLKINLQGPYFLSQAAAHWMIEQKKANHAFDGCIVNISSISAEIASVNRGEYCVSKAALRMMTKLFAARLGGYHIPVYEVQPGIIQTDMTAGVKEKYDVLIEQGLTIQKRWGLPEDVGKAVASLARGDFAYSTGSVIPVDGGLTVGRL